MKGGEVKEIGFLLPDEPVSVEIRPALAKNLWPLKSSLKAEGTREDYPPFEGERVVALEEERAIVVDDEDDGFRLDLSAGPCSAGFGKSAEADSAYG